MKKFIYISAPYSGDTEKNTENLIQFCREIVKKRPDVVPIAPALYFPKFLDDNTPEEREAALRMDLDLLEMCDELWAYGTEISEGMNLEIAYAMQRGIPVYASTEVKEAQDEEELSDLILQLRVPGIPKGDITITGEVLLESAKKARWNRGQDMIMEIEE